MAENKEQKTQLLTDTPPEVQAAIDRQRPSGGAPASGQSTMLLDAPGPAVVAARAAAPAAAPRAAAPLPRAASPARPTSSGPSAVRWVIGPILAIAIGTGTVFAAARFLPSPAAPPPPPKVMGKLHVSTIPAGASITVDGKPFPHFTPTDLSGEVGTPVTLGFKLDGYQTKEMDVAFASGERPLAVTLEKAKDTVTPPVAPLPTTPVADTTAHHDHDHDHHATTTTKTPPKETGTGTLSVYVRPWAIVFVDDKKLKQTPVQAFPLSAGKHTIELVNDGKGKHEKFPITIKANDAQELRRDWDN